MTLRPIPFADLYFLDRPRLELPANLDWAIWEILGRQLQEVGSIWQFLVGDWVLYGEANYGEDTYQAIADDLGLSSETIRKCVWVCQSVAPERRVGYPVRFSHHEVVAALSHDDQEYYLQMAAKEHWTVSTLRNTIKRERLEEQPEQPFHVEQPQPQVAVRWVRCPQCQHEWSEE